MSGDMGCRDGDMEDIEDIDDIEDRDDRELE